MKRSDADHSRRRALHDAATGITRVAVVLYACVDDKRDPAVVMGELRAHAHARDWTVRAELCDTALPPKPRGERAGWRRAEDLLSTGQAEGVIAVVESELTDGSRQRQVAWRAWLAEHNLAPSASRAHDAALGGQTATPAAPPTTSREHIR